MASQDSGAGWNAGGGVKLNEEGVTVYVSAAANSSNGQAKDADTAYTYSHFGGANQTVFAVTGDLNLIGGIITGNTVTGAVGGNLNIISPQDLSLYSSSESSSPLR